MAAKEVYQEDLMIHTVKTTTGYLYYILERQPFETSGVKQGIFKRGTFTDAVFNDPGAAAAELVKFPHRPDAGTSDAAADDDTADVKDAAEQVEA